MSIIPSIPLVVVLWEHAGFRGRRRIIVHNTPKLIQQGFNDITSAIGVHKGPNYDSVTTVQGWEPTVGFYEHVNYGGAELVLGWGHYANIHTLFSFGEIISSLRFNPTREHFPRSSTKPHTFTSIPLVVELYKDENFRGDRVTVIENISNIINYLGKDWNDVVTSVRVRPGPNYSSGKVVELLRNVDFLGGGVSLGPGNYRNIGTSHGFSDIVSSIRFS